jgi:hypothetical protein
MQKHSLDDLAFAIEFKVNINLNLIYEENNIFHLEYSKF